MYAAIRTHRHRRPQRINRLRWPATKGENVLHAVGIRFFLADAHGFFDGELVEGVHAVFFAHGLDACAGLVDAGLNLGGFVRGREEELEEGDQQYSL